MKKSLASVQIDVNDNNVNSSVEGSTKYVLTGMASVLATIIRRVAKDDYQEKLIDAFIKDVKENLELQNKKTRWQF